MHWTQKMLELKDPSYIEFVKNLEDGILSDIQIHKSEQYSLSFENFLFKTIINEMGYYFLVTKTLIDNLSELLKGKRCLEIMAGNGFFSKQLINNGIDIVATDDFSWKLANPESHIKQYDAVEAVKTFKEQSDILIICWPYMDDTAYRAIKEWGSDKPIIVCAEIGGCCADWQFDVAYKRETLSVGFQSFTGIHDEFYIGHYQPIEE